MNKHSLTLHLLLIFLAGKSCLAQAGGDNDGQPNRRSVGGSEARLLLPRSGLRVPDLVVDHLYDLINLIQITREDSPSSSRPSKFESIQVFEDSNDAAVVARVRSPSNEDTCIAVFQATDFENVLDVAQLFNWETETITVKGGGNSVSSCTFRAGMVSAYYHSSYYNEFVAAVDRCMATNKLQKTPKLLLGGHSQGGAISVVASVDLNRYEPTVVTLGAVRSLVEPCITTTQAIIGTLSMLMNETTTGQGQSGITTPPIMNPVNHYRFVNAVNSAYDYWTTVFNRNGIHIGQPIFLDPTANPGYMASYTYLNDDFNMEPTETFNHDPDIYWLSISQWLEYEKAQCTQAAAATGERCEFIVGGWEDGHHCNLASECTEGFCVKSTCRSQP